MRRALIGFAILTATLTPALSQQVSPEQGAAAALGQQIGLLSFANAQQQTRLLEAQQKIAQLEARIRELEAKLPKEEDKKSD